MGQWQSRIDLNFKFPSQPSRIFHPSTGLAQEEDMAVLVCYGILYSYHSYEVLNCKLFAFQI